VFMCDPKTLLARLRCSMSNHLVIWLAREIGQDKLQFHLIIIIDTCTCSKIIQNNVKNEKENLRRSKK
jgi:hypothetical protein